MSRFKTLRVRFALWTSTLLLVILVLFSAYVYGSIKRSLSATIDQSLVINATQIAAGLNIENGRLTLSESLIEPPEEADLRGQGFTLRILTPQGKVLQEFGPYRNIPVLLPLSFANYTDPVSQITFRIYNHPVYENEQLVAIVQVAQSLANMEDTLQKLLAIFLIGIPGLVLVAGVGGYFLAARALAPIDQIISTARRISAEDLSARLSIPATDDEVGRLTQTLNDMLSRLDQSFQRERQFTHDASHELRTPLAIMQAIIETMRERERTAEEYQQAFDDLHEEVDRLRTLVENLLQLARGKKQSNSFEMIDLSTLIQDVTDSLRPLAEAKNLSLNCETPANLTVWGDRDELIRLLVNLLDNALKYTDHGEIWVKATQSDRHVQIQVMDTGIGIAAEHLPHIFDRFYRIDTSRTQRGAGLGLAIAKEIVQAHRGEIEAASKIGQGTVFTVKFPRADLP